MNTEHLINLLAKNARQDLPSKKPLYWHTMVWSLGLCVCLVLTIVLYKVNPKLLEAASSVWFWLRFAFLVSLGALTWIALLTLRNPATALKAKMKWLLLPFALLTLISIVFLLATPADERLAMMLGSSWKVGSLSIAFLTVPVFIASVVVVRQHAPTRLNLTGAIIGLFSGSTAALIYTLHCPELAPPFLLIWYSLGIFIPGLVGWVFGRYFLRW